MAKYKFYGTAKWAKTKVPDKDYDVYSINLYMDPRSLKLYEKSGIQGKLKEDEDGIYKSFRRPVTQMRKGVPVEAGPPKVTYNGEKFDGLIGNGSQVSIIVDVYETRKGIGHRLEEVEVDNLVEYNAVMDAADVDPEDTEVVEKPKAAKPKGKLNDELPF